MGKPISTWWARVSSAVVYSSFALGLAHGVFASQRGPVYWRGHPVSRLSGGLHAAISETGEKTDFVYSHRLAPADSDPGGWLTPSAGWPISLGPDPTGLNVAAINQAEPHLVRHPSAPLLLLAVFQDGRLTNGGASGSGLGLSVDGGFSWRRFAHPNLTINDRTGLYYRSTDPVAAIDLSGRYYTNHLVAVTTDFSRSNVVVSRSDDSGATWGLPVVVTQSRYVSQQDEDFPDKNWLAVDDFPDSPHQGRLVCTWTKFRTLESSGRYRYSDSSILGSYSDDHGLSWSQPVVISDPPPVWTPGNPFLNHTQSYQSSLPIFLPGGRLAVFYWKFGDLNTGVNDAIHFTVSYDGGRTFSSLRPLVSTVPLTFTDDTARSGGFIFAGAASRLTGTVFLAWQARATATAKGKIFVCRSIEQAESNGEPHWTWSSPVVVSGDDPAAAFNPAMSVAEDGAVVQVVWHDKRHDSGSGYFCDLYLAESLDGGLTWRDPVRISPSSIDLRTATLTDSGYMIGDYFGMVEPVAGDPASVALWVGSGATGTDPFISRIGADPNNGFNRWCHTRFSAMERVTSGQGGPLDDFDADGIPNLTEYIGTTDPKTASSPAISIRYVDPAFSRYDDTVWVNPAFSPELKFSAQWSRNGVDWSEVEPQWISQHRPNRGTVDMRLLWPQPTGAALPLRRLLAWTSADSATVVELARTPHPLALESPLDAVWFWSPWLGFCATRQFPWVYQVDLGWFYCYSDGSPHQFWYDLALGWLYSGPNCYPDIYHFASMNWVRHLPIQGQPRLFYRYSDNSWVDW